jgi:circadian clock protein KaiC
MRYFEASGHLRRAISVMKKRRGAHEATIREYRLSQGGLLLGEPLEEFQGVLTGVPSYFGASGSLMQK